MRIPKLGFCCKWLEPNRNLVSKEILTREKSMNQKGTTVTFLKKLDPTSQYGKLYDITKTNCEILWRQLEWVSQQPLGMRMFRITSEMIPVYTLPEFSFIFQDSDFRKMVQVGLKGIRSFADKHEIRLCSHPGPFTNICSTNDIVVENAIKDLEYHTMLAVSMGYGDTWHSSGFAMNIHGNIKQDPDLSRFKRVVQNKLSKEARNLITLENDEFCCRVEDLQKSNIGQEIALVLDIHHHFIATGEYIQKDDPRIQIFIDSWRDQRPLGHFSVSSEEVLNDHCQQTLPNLESLKAQGFHQSALRAHSYLMWNKAVNNWALSHLSWTDLEIEAKGKNLASKQLYDFYHNIEIGNNQI